MSSEDAEEMLENALVGRLGTSFKNKPYVVPLNFVYSNKKIYFHCAKNGKKLEIIADNSHVCFEVDEFLGIKQDEKPCSFGSYYKSAMAFGKAKVLEKSEKKAKALKKILSKYATELIDFAFNMEELGRVEVVEILVDRITGKQSLP